MDEFKKAIVEAANYAANSRCLYMYNTASILHDIAAHVTTNYADYKDARNLFYNYKNKGCSGWSTIILCLDLGAGIDFPSLKSKFKK